MTLLDEPSIETVPPVVVPPDAPLPEPEAKVGRVRGWLGELKPSVVTGGADVSPLLLLGVMNVVDGFDANT